MFLHNFKYFTKELMRSGSMTFWVFIFPLALMTLFKFAFSNITATTESFSEIPVAVVYTGEESEIFRTTVEGLESGGKKLFSITSTNSDEALALLKEKKIEGIITVSDDILSLSTTEGSSISKSIVSGFVTQYNTNVSIIKEVLATNPQNIGAVLEAMEAEISSINSTSLAGENTDVFVTYYYGLFAMTCLFASMHGMFCSITFQANLSATGMRISVSPVKKLPLILSALLSSSLIQILAVAIACVYAFFILGINMGVDFGLFLLICIIGSLTAVGMGYFVGTIGRMSDGVKNGILLGITMAGSILAGLIDQGIVYQINTSCPIINRISPAGLISDCFYSVNIFGDYGRLMENFLILGAEFVIFCIGGALISRRRKYASL